ncbi:MAG: hypothetical protein CFE21_13265 [Bacteroidetes bacterium B1(2017)]|nr:MAG: hypothetical protein CFE21_13265 [Bacteroidetes bacterium B1(2017)]
MLKKLLFAIFVLANFSAYSQFPDVIASAKLPATDGQILDVVDYNNDGFEDVVYQNGVSGTIEIYRNLNGVFSNVTTYTGFPSISGAGDGMEGVISFDYNNDGFQDLLVMKSNSDGYMRLFKNNCGVTFQEVTPAVGLPPTPNIIPANQTKDPLVLISDYDGDKDNDIIYSRVGATENEIVVLPNSFGVFGSPIVLISGLTSAIIPYIALINYDNDQDEDLLIIKVSSISNACVVDLYDNSLGSFTVVSSGISNSSPVGFANIADLDNDGYMDILLGTKEVVNPGPGNSGCKVFHNNAGVGTFSNITSSYATISGSSSGDYFNAHVFDMDNDGDNDVLWEVNRNLQLTSIPALMRNNGSNVFANARGALIPSATTETNGFSKYTVFDYNNDGTLDIFMPGTSASPAKLFNNILASNNYANFRLLSCTGQADPIGTRVYVKAGTFSQTQVYGSQGITTSTTGKSERLHFGLGGNAVMDSIIIYWPDNFTTPDIYTNVNSNQNINYQNGSCPLGIPLTFDLGPDTTSVCNQDTAYLSAPAGYVSYTWNTGDITPDVKFTKSGWYFCTVTNVDFCSSMDSIYVNFGIGKIVQTDTTVCANSPYTLDALPRFDCSPFGAPVKRAPLADGEVFDPNFIYVGSTGGHHYYRLKIASKWTDAAKAARDAGGYLVVVNDQIEQDYITSQTSLKGFNLWTGLYRPNAFSAFRWVNCDSLNYTNWDLTANAPTPGATQSYVYMRSDLCTEPRQWKNTDENTVNPDPCESTFYGLVEFDASTNISYIWSNGDTTASTVVSPTAPTSYFVEIIQNGAHCFGTVNLNVIDPNNFFGIDTLTECKASFVQLFAPPGMTKYKWSNGGSLDNTYYGSSSSNKWVSCAITTPEGCIGKDSIYIVIFNTNILTPDTAVCLGSPVFLRGPTPPYAYSTDYYQDFQSAPFGGWNSASSINFNATKMLGPFANDSVTYNYAGLPAHDSIIVTFDLYIHDTWDGDDAIAGKDYFRFKNGNTNLINATFSNNPASSQSYSASGLPGTYPAFTDGLSGLPRRCDNNGSTTKYTITKKMKHTSSNLDLSWVGELVDTADNSGKCAESWSLDNIKIDIRRPANLLWSTGDTDRNITVNPIDPSTVYWVRIPVETGYCYDSVTVTTYTGRVPADLLGYDTLRNCNVYQDSYTLPANFDKYVWSNGDTGRIATFYNEGWYVGYVYSNYGCYGSDSVFVAFNKATIVPSSDTSVCYGTALTIKANQHNDCSPFGGPANSGYIAGQPIPGYTYKGEYRSHFYYLADTHSSWSVAAQNALAAGGHLAAINDTSEQGFISDMVDSNAWLGLYSGSAGYYVWMNCDTLTYTNFAGGEPTPNPNNYVYLTSKACPEPHKWASNTDSDTLSSDPCHNTMYGLLEIYPIPHIYDWQENGISISNADSVVVYPTGDVSYRGFTGKYDNGPYCGTKTIHISVANEFFDILPDSVSKISCAGDTAMIEAKIGYSNYHWDNGDTNRIAVYSGLVGWAYCYYDNGSCKFTDSVFVNVPGKLTTTPIVTDITCYGANDGIANSGVTGGTVPIAIQWLHNGSTNAIETNLSPGVYYYSVLDTNGCSAIDSVTITNPDSALNANFVTVQPVGCSNDSNAIVVGLPYGGSAPYFGTWVGYSLSDTLWFKGAGIYTYSVTDGRGCVFTKDDTIARPPVLDLSATIFKQVFCNEDTDGVVILNVTGGVGPYHFAWNYNLIYNDTITGVKGGTYMAYVLDTNYCYDSVAVNMVPSNPDKCGLVVSSGFTPNGDGHNDFFYIKGLSDFPDNELTIFNRWGETVYHAVNYQNNWDGKPNKNTLLSGNDGIVPNDTYFYILVTKANNKTSTGYVYITK